MRPDMLIPIAADEKSNAIAIGTKAQTPGRPILYRDATGTAAG